MTLRTTGCAAATTAWTTVHAGEATAQAEREVSVRPARHAVPTASTLECTPSLPRTFLTWVCTVAGLMPSSTRELGGRGSVGERRRGSRARGRSASRGARARCAVPAPATGDRRAIGSSATGRTSSPARARRNAATRCAGSRSIGRTPHAPAASASSTRGEATCRVAAITRVSEAVAERGDQRDALLVGAIQIHDHDVDGRLGERLERAGLVGHRAEHLEPGPPAKRQQQGLCQTEAVVHDEDPDARPSHGEHRQLAAAN